MEKKEKPKETSLISYIQDDTLGITQSSGLDLHGIYFCNRTRGIHSPAKMKLCDIRCGRIRRLTPKECFRLQGFPDVLYEKAAAVSSETQLYKQAGNAVTVTVAYAVAMTLPESR